MRQEQNIEMKDSNSSDQYFESYNDLEVHRLMLEDHPRTESFKNAILNNKSFIEGKVIMDVGAGTGILSVLCVQAGAKKVYAVEASNLAKLAESVVAENKMSNIIQVINKKVEEIELPTIEKVDIIISEWMGFYLLHEGMLDSVFYARDKFLTSNGIMFPESATIYVSPCRLPSLNEQWNNMYGVSMACFASELRNSKRNKPEVMTINPEDLLGEETALCWIDLKEDSPSSTSHYLMTHVTGAAKAGKFQGMCIWFDCKFPQTDPNYDSIYLNTSPSSPSTHWKQTVIVLPEEVSVEEGEPIAWELAIKRSEKSSRRYDIELSTLDPSNIDHPVPCSCDMTKCIVIRTFMEQHNSVDEDAAKPDGDSR